MSYRFFKFMFATFLVVYFIGGLMARNTSKREVFPFFSWFLFDEVSNERWDFTIKIISHGDNTYNPPLEFSQTTQLFETIHQSATQYFYIIQVLGDAILGKEKDKIKENREKLEKIFLNMPTKYEVFHIKYNPILYWKTGEVKESKLIATFEI